MNPTLKKMDSALLHPDASHRFAPNTADNDSAKLWIASILCLIYCTLTLVIRLHIKWRLYGADDAAITLASILQLGENIPLFVALKSGLGVAEQRLDNSKLQIIGKATFIAQLFYISSLMMAKLSVAALLLRLFTRDIIVTRKSRMLCHATTALTVVWAIGSLIATGTSCSPSQFAQTGTKGFCSSRLTQWRVTTAFDILTEMLLMALPVMFVFPIQMKRYIKLQVAIAFGFRLPIVVIAAVHLHYVSKYTGGSNTSQAMIPALVLQQCELLWSLLSATIPTLKAFMRTFNSGFGMEIDLDSPYSHRHGRQDSKTYILGSAEGSKGRDPGSLQNANANLHFGKGEHRSVVCSGGPAATNFDKTKCKRPSSGFTTDSTQDLAIKREMEWSVSCEENDITHEAQAIALK